MTQAQLESKIQSAIDKTTDKFVPSSFGYEYNTNKQRILDDVEDEKVSDLCYTFEGVFNSYNNGISDFKEELQARLEEIYREITLSSM